MDELVRLVAAKAGLPEAQARAAVTAVLDFLKQKLPAPIAGQLEAAVSGGRRPPRRTRRSKVWGPRWTR